MDSHSVFPFLRLSAELRLEIYKHVWTVSEEDHVYRVDFRYKDSKFRLTVDYLKAQLSAIRKLGAISHRIRAEAYPKYFDHTQVLLRYDSAWVKEDLLVPRESPGWDNYNRSALYILGGSYLLHTQARHVKSYWPDRVRYHRWKWLMGESCARARNQEELLNEQWALECLSRFKNLRSLEVHLANGTQCVMTDYFWKLTWSYFLLNHPDPDSSYPHKQELKRMFYDDERRAKLIEGMKTNHRKLENAVVRTNISDPRTIKALDEHESFEWWRQLKRDMAALASRSPSSVVCTLPALTTWLPQLPHVQFYKI